MQKLTVLKIATAIAILPAGEPMLWGIIAKFDLMAPAVLMVFLGMLGLLLINHLEKSDLFANDEFIVDADYFVTETKKG